MSQSRQGQLIQMDAFDNVGGLNLADSPFKIADTQSIGGLNLDYSLTGGIKKRMGHEKINSSADTETKSIGLGLYNSTTSTKRLIRAAGTRLQLFDSSAPSFTNLSEDTVAAGSAPLTSGSTQPVVFTQFNNSDSSILWATGGGQTQFNGVYSSSKYTANGTPAPTGTITKTVNAAAGGSFAATGTYYYAVAFRKLGTQAVSNAALDVSATIANTTDTVTITLTSISNVDTTKYDKIYLYRSAVGGASAFTTGDLVAQANSNATTITDTGGYITTAGNIPRAGNTIKDNSVLPSGTYNACTMFKRRLVTASGSTLYFSDLNLSESWPTTNVITIPSGGNITALGVISFTSPQAQTLDEILVVFKERELWVVTGNSYSDWVLKFIDVVGCPVQSLLVSGNGFLYWMDYRGIYMWEGSGKPIYLSRPIEPLFTQNGDLDKTYLSQGHAVFSRRTNQVVWFLSHKTYGVQKYAIKLDLRLTLPGVNQALTGRVLDGVFSQDSFPMALYGSMYYLPTGGADELMLIGDNSGYIYKGYNSFADGGANYSFTYATKIFDMGSPGTRKRFHKVVVWVQEVGTWDLYLDYWTDYRSASGEKATLAEPIAATNGSTAALWDLASWDVSYWDDYTPRLRPITFNLNSGNMNSNEGTSLLLQFRNETANQPVTIAGFSVVYSISGLAA